MKEVKLKDCPFCGVNPKTTNDFPVKGLTTISCENKECKVHPYKVGRTFDEAAAGWNGRV